MYWSIIRKDVYMNTPEKSNKLQRRIDLALTALFLAVIFFFGAMTLATDWRGILRAARSSSRVSGYLADPDNYTAWDYFCARIASVDNYLAQNLYLSEEMGYLNSSFQYALGKRMVTTGGSQMIRLNSGHLYDLQDYVSMETGVENIVSMKNIVPDGTPFLFVYEHPTIYSEDQLPEGYDVLDYSDESAREIVERMADTGIRMLDSRDILPASGVPMEQYLMYTDKHWSTRASLILAQRIAQEISDMTGVDLHPEKLDIENFETYTYEKLFLGNYGQRVGPMNIDPDDITIYWPRETTHISRYTNYLGEITEIEGDFKQSVIRWKYLEPDEGKTYNFKAYFDYGLTENYDIFRNPDAADCTVLLLKDSYSASIGSFLSLVADEVYTVDLRRSELSLQEWIDESDPDIVVCAYSLLMLRQDEYEFQ